MQLEVWIAVDGHDFSIPRGDVSRFTCGGVSIFFALHSNPRHPRVAWSKAAVRRGTKFGSMNTFLKAKHGTSTPCPLGCEWRFVVNSVFFFTFNFVKVKVKVNFMSCPFLVLNRHGWKPFFIRDIHRMDIWSLEPFFGGCSDAGQT